jgi:hypothetical protein
MASRWMADSMSFLSVPSLQGHVVKPEELLRISRKPPTFSSLFAGTCGETKNKGTSFERAICLSVPSLQGHVVKQMAGVPCRLGLRPVWSGVFSKSLQWPLPPRCFAKFPFHLPLGPTTPECQALAPTPFDPRHSPKSPPNSLDLGTSPLNLRHLQCPPQSKTKFEAPGTMFSSMDRSLQRSDTPNRPVIVNGTVRGDSPFCPMPPVPSSKISMGGQNSPLPSTWA